MQAHQLIEIQGMQRHHSDQNPKGEYRQSKLKFDLNHAVLDAKIKRPPVRKTN